jgi:hypothetical protein
MVIDLVHTDAADFAFPAFFADTLVRIYFIHTCTSILTRVQLAVIYVWSEQTTHKLILSKRRKSGGGGTSWAEIINFTLQLHRLPVLQILCS